jgi:hypothetical protein
MGGNIGKLFGGTDEDKKYRDEFLKENKIPLMGAGLSALMLSREEPKATKQDTGGYQTFNPTYNRIMQSGGNYQAGAYPSATGERRYFADGGLANLPVEQDVASKLLWGQTLTSLWLTYAHTVIQLQEMFPYLRTYLSQQIMSVLTHIQVRQSLLRKVLI